MILGIIMILYSIVGFVFATMAFGDIGLAFGYSAFISLMVGVYSIINQKNRNK